MRNEDARGGKVSCTSSNGTVCMCEGDRRLRLDRQAWDQVVCQTPRNLNSQLGSQERTHGYLGIRLIILISSFIFNPMRRTFRFNENWRTEAVFVSICSMPAVNTTTTWHGAHMNLVHLSVNIHELKGKISTDLSKHGCV